MPSPIAHAVSGYAIARGLDIANIYKVWPLALYPIFVAIAADFDFIPQLVADVDTHRGLTHSISFAVVFSLLVSKLVSRHLAIGYKRLLVLTLVLYGSHLVLDFFTQGGAGIPLLWPLSHQMFQSAVPLFPAVRHSHGLFDPIHLFFLSFELVYTVVLLWGLSRWQTFKYQRQENISRLD